MDERTFLVAALLLGFFASLAAGRCVMRSICPSEDDEKNPCALHVPSEALSSDRGRQLLLDLCGDLFPDPYSAVCCSDDQMLEFAEQIESAKSIGIDNCPACGTNFKNLVCSMLCSPEQHEFVQLVSTGVGRKGDMYVGELNYYLDSRFTSGMYNACSNAYSRIPSIKLLNFMCGKWGEECNAERWLQFLGATADGGGFSPLQINYVQTQETEVLINGTVFRPMNVPPYPCNTEDASKVCHCRHCPDACVAEATTARGTA